MQKENQDRQPAEGPGGGSARLNRLRSIARRVLPFVAAVAAVLMGLYIYRALFPAPAPLELDDINERIVLVLASATPEPAISSQVYDLILPSIVYIQTKIDDPENDEAGSVGSGVVINESGDILTALHVVAEAEEIQVIFSDGFQTAAELLDSDPANDIAVLHPLEPPQLIVPAVLGSPGAARIGDEAFAVGNPLGLVGSMSAGVISGFNRSIPLDEDGMRLEGLIQFDAAVNPGNSGGPLLNRYGQVIGIVTALANPSDQNFFTGIGFAVPITVAAEAAGGFEY